MSNNLTVWDKYAADGTEAFNLAKYQEAEACWYTAVQVAEYFGEHDPRLHESLEKLAEVYYATGRFDEGEKLARRAGQIKVRISGVNLRPPPSFNGIFP